MELLVSLVLGLLFLWLMMNVVSMTRESAAEYATHKTCRDSVDIHTTSKQLHIDAEKELQCGTVVRNVGRMTDAHLKELIKEEAYWCGWQYQWGTKELYSSDGKYCSLCAHIHLKKNKKMTVNLADIFPASDDEKKTYEGSFGSFEEPEYSLSPEQIGTFEIDTSKYDRYDVVFVYIKGKDAIEEIGNRQKSVAVGAVGGGSLVAAGLGAGYVGGAIVEATVAVGAVGAATATPGAAAVMAGGAVLSAVAMPLLIVGGAVIIGAVVYNHYFAEQPPEWVAMRVLIPHDAGYMRYYGCEELAQSVEGSYDS
ncbi:MAG: hypothetical protein QS99_C0018G0007 [archaeon GW2011_AR4]|nr:MAG: hypothetical protein QS99_C0018G0007 [archaeon GW2011_AR4]